MKGEKRQGQKDLRAKYDSQSFMCFQKYVAVGSQQIKVQCLLLIMVEKLRKCLRAKKYTFCLELSKGFFTKQERNLRKYIKEKKAKLQTGRSVLTLALPLSFGCAFDIQNHRLLT